jgi:hypothetical protein
VFYFGTYNGVQDNRKPVGKGFAIFRQTICQGTMPACYDETEYPVVFPTELDAQREIADTQLTLIKQFLDGERDFHDAITTDEFVLPVDVWLDGSISTEEGWIYGKAK